MNTTWNKIMATFRTNTLIGLLLLAPLAGTLLILNFLITFVSKQVLPKELLESDFAILYRIAALIIVIAALYFVGLLTRNFFGRKIYRLADLILTRIPVINSVYTSIRQISEALVSTQSTLFKEVIVVQFPRTGLYAIGFVTARVPETIARKIETTGKSEAPRGKPRGIFAEPSEAKDAIPPCGKPQGFLAKEGEMICAFVPTAPNPTSGFFLMVPRSEVIYLNISVAAAMKMVISSGAVSPWKSEAVSRLTLLDHIEAWLKRGETTPSPPEPPASENKPAESK